MDGLGAACLHQGQLGRVAFSQHGTQFGTSSRQDGGALRGDKLGLRNWAAKGRRHAGCF